jgi:hypothetical protein
MSRFIGVQREHVFSPGRESDDDAVLGLVAANLRTAGHVVSVCRGDDAAWPEPDAQTVVFAMCQSESAVARLQTWESRGLRIVNRPRGILNCLRHRTLPILQAAGVVIPESLIVDLGTEFDAILPGEAWVKRGDVHATEAGDVVFAADAAAVRVALRRFRERGLRRAVVQRHIPGRVVKFYGVSSRFFHCVVPKDAPVLPAATRAGIAVIGQTAATALGVDVFGGDCVVEPNGELTIIDLNDWPSYAACRAEAAKAIAAHLLAL